MFRKENGKPSAEGTSTEVVVQDTAKKILTIITVSVTGIEIKEDKILVDY